MYLDRYIYGFQSLLDFQVLPGGRLLVVAATASEVTGGATQDRLFLLDPSRNKSIFLNEVARSPSRLYPAWLDGPLVLTHSIRYKNHRHHVTLLDPRSARPRCKTLLSGLPQSVAGVAPGDVYVLGVVSKKGGLGQSLLHRIDPRTCAPKETLVQLEPMAQAIAITSKRKLYVAYAAPRHVPVRTRNTVVVYDVDSGHEKGRISVPDSPFLLRVVGGYLVVVHFDPASRSGSTVSVIDTSTDSLKRVFKAHRVAPFGTCLLENGRRVLVPQIRAGGFFELAPEKGGFALRTFGPRRRYKDPPQIIRCRGGA